RLARIAVTAAIVGALALGIVTVGGILGTHPAPAPAGAVVVPPTDALTATIARAQDRLRTLPKDWQTWASLASAYVEQARVTADPPYYPKAEGAAKLSLALRPDGNPYGHIALGALANARHDFALARSEALAALAVDAYSADAYGVLADAQTQLGNASAATDA